MTARYLADFRLADLEREYHDYLIVGTGIAGLYTALKTRQHGSVCILTKRKLEDSNTDHAQGGIAAAIGHADSPRLHMTDTLEAGVGLCDEQAVEVLVNEGPDCVMELVDIGTEFDMQGDDFALTREGAHSMRRVLHARGDATGEEIRRALSVEVGRHPDIIVHEDTFVIDALTAGGVCCGVIALDARTGRKIAYLARGTVIATGGAGQLYRYTTNPEVATGDGIAIAYRAGAEVQDVEFIQFHPTALAKAGAPRFLISEAVRGEGGILRDRTGHRFMPEYDPRAELAPRDIVARAIVRQVEKVGGKSAFLDVTHLGAQMRERFPNIWQTCNRYGIDFTRDLIPVSPAAHYFMGGIRTDTSGRTSIPGLYACGEAACVGVHGANRLASNSLLEGLVFGKRIAEAMVGNSAGPSRAQLQQLDLEAVADRHELGCDAGALRQRLQSIMWDDVGITRNAAGLTRAREQLARLDQEFRHCALTSEGEFELANLLTLSRLVADAALRREESRGGHYRSDFPARNDANWKTHIVLQNRETGSVD
ncbi:MAG: L-aspartate oxidase [Chloroflexota bacterium]